LATGQGLTCVLSNQVDVHVAAGRLRRLLLEYEPPPIPIHVLHPDGRYLSPKVGLFIDDATTAIRQKFAAA
jgi:DNA-binding transcriptional LysR family regulator